MAHRAHSGPFFADLAPRDYFSGYVNVSRAKLAGYAHLVKKYAVNAPALLHASWVDEVSTRRAILVGMTIEETFPIAYDPGDSDFDHLIFALKYDGVDLAVLARLFRWLDRGELEPRITAQPISKYCRRIFFLFERLTGERLAIDDLPRGRYSPVLDPDEYFVAAGRPSARHRVIDNLLGDAGFCPIIRRTPKLVAAAAKDLGARALAITRAVDPVVLARAISFLYTKETRSSFAIEHEEIEPGNRMERFLAQLAAIGERPLDTESALTELQRAFIDPRYAERVFAAPGSRRSTSARPSDFTRRSITWGRAARTRPSSWPPGPACGRSSALAGP